MNKYGFFGIIGAIGLAGMVVNDAIVMIKKLDDTYQASPVMLTDDDISGIAASRLKAVLLTTITTVAGLFPTAYGIFGFDSMLAEMMLALAWGLAFGTLITLILIPALFKSLIQLEKYFVEK
jgi:multidrug efflux pump subunit AcrB